MTWKIQVKTKTYKRNNNSRLEQTYLTRCLESPTDVTVQKIKEVNFPSVASNYNLKQYPT